MTDIHPISPGMHWELFAHMADIGLRGYGRSLEESFEQAALALTATITDPAKVEPRQAISIQCQGADPELLLVDWLNALIYEMATRRMLFGHFEVGIKGDVLEATAWGETVDRDRHEPAVEVKGATYTELKVVLQDGQWIAQCVIDV